jgi:hypothetical protein
MSRVARRATMRVGAFVVAVEVERGCGLNAREADQREKNDECVASRLPGHSRGWQTIYQLAVRRILAKPGSKVFNEVATKRPSRLERGFDFGRLTRHSDLIAMGRSIRGAKMVEMWAFFVQAPFTCRHQKNRGWENHRYTLGGSRRMIRRGS